VLNLAHCPAVVAVEDFLKDVKVVVEGKAQVEDSAVGQGFVRFGQKVAVAHDRPAGLAQAMEKVKVDVVCLEFFQLLVQVTVKILSGLDGPYGQLGG
jgi:hypothetical protein